jgi:tetratricopeptide (TPR) repeat protein
MSQSNDNNKLENFDDLFVGHPSEIEKNLSEILPQAQALENKSIYLQILSQIALAQAMQKNFTEAHKTLDLAEEGLTSEYNLARVRIYLERGRVFHQADNKDAALPLFKKSFDLSKKNKFDFHTINAAHMVAIVVKNIDEKIKWNKRAIDLASKTQDKRAHRWLGALYNNLAQNYLQGQLYMEARCAFEQSKKFGEDRGDAIIIRGAKWGIGRSLRSLGLLDQALDIQLALLKEYDDIAKKDKLPIELLVVARGMVYEELAEIHLIKTKKYSSFAYSDLSKDPWFAKLEPKRLEKMKQLKDVAFHD